MWANVLGVSADSTVWPKEKQYHGNSMKAEKSMENQRRNIEKQPGFQNESLRLWYAMA